MPKTNAVTMTIIAEEQMTPEKDARIRQALTICFPDDAAVFSVTRAWHGSHPRFSVIGEAEGLVAAHVGVVERNVLFGNTPLRVGGIQNVFVCPAYRGRHLSGPLLHQALEEARRRIFDLGLLFCSAELVPVYARSGWIPLQDRKIIASDETGREMTLAPKQIAMFHPLQAEAPPLGPIHLCGRDW